MVFEGASGKLDPYWGQLQWTDLTMATHMALCSEAVFQGWCNTCVHPVPVSPHLLQYSFTAQKMSTNTWNIQLICFCHVYCSLSLY